MCQCVGIGIPIYLNYVELFRAGNRVILMSVSSDVREQEVRYLQVPTACPGLRYELVGEDKPIEVSL